MAEINFPSSPIAGQTIISPDGTYWLFDGSYWVVLSRPRNIRWPGTTARSIIIETGASSVLTLGTERGASLDFYDEATGNPGIFLLKALHTSGGYGASLYGVPAGGLCWSRAFNAPAAWGGAVPSAFQVEHVGIAANSNGVTAFFTSNGWYDGTDWRAINAGSVAAIRFEGRTGTDESSGFTFYSAPKVAAGAVATLASVFTIDHTTGVVSVLGARQTTTPTPTSGSGAFAAGSPTSVLCTVNYHRLGASALVDVTVTIIDNGTAAGHISVPMPFTAAKETVFAGRQAASGGAMCQGIMASGSANLIITKYDNTYPGATGERITVSGHIPI